MQLTDEQFNAIEHLLPTPRGNVKIHHRAVIDACLYMLKEGCTWRSLPARYGHWHTIYTRWNRWSKKGVWEKVYKGLQARGIAPSTAQVGGLDSTSVKVHKHGAGALKKTASKPSVDRAAA